jgi:hypothetical protein
VRKIRQDSKNWREAGLITTRQQILVLYLSDSALDAFVVSWSFYDGTGGARPVAGEEEGAPCKTGLQAFDIDIG